MNKIDNLIKTANILHTLVLSLDGINGLLKMGYSAKKIQYIQDHTDSICRTLQINKKLGQILNS